MLGVVSLPRVVLALAAVSLSSVPALAGPSADTLIGVFSNPIYAGNVLNDPSPGYITYVDNSITGLPNTYITNGGSQLQWGNNSTTSPPPANQYSTLSFTGAQSVATNTTAPVLLGSITYLNGTSALNTLIFGATLSFYVNSVSVDNLVATDTVYITTTSNTSSGTGLTQAQLQTDADYVNICGNLSNICGSSIEAYEDSEGGTGLTVNLYGTIMGDPQLTLSSVAVAPGQNPNTSGTVGSQASQAVAEPGSLALLGAFLLVLAALRRRALPRGEPGSAAAVAG